MNIKKIIILWFLSFTFLLSQNTGKISQRITDAKSKEGIPGANIVMKGTILGAITGMDGTYFILNITPGEYDVSTSMLGIFHHRKKEKI